VARTPDKEILSRSWLIYSYRWEFLRRNKTYQKDYLNFLKKTKGQRVERRERSQEHRIMRDKYGFKPTDFNLSYEDIFAIIKGRSDKAKNFTPWQNEEIRAFNQTCRMDGYVVDEVDCSEDDLDKYFNHSEKMTFKPIPWPGDRKGRKELSRVKTLRVLVNLSYPQEVIDCHMGWIIKHYQSFIKRRRFDYNKLSEYLKIYDLKVQGKTFAAIAHELFPHRTDRRSYNSTLEMVKRGYKKACRLINGEWPQIR